MIFNGALVPVIPLPPKPLKRKEETLRTCGAHQNHSVEKQWHLSTLKAICQCLWTSILCEGHPGGGIG
jgi:hypothetical protein